MVGWLVGYTDDSTTANSDDDDDGNDAATATATKTKTKTATKTKRRRRRRPPFNSGLVGCSVGWLQCWLVAVLVGCSVGCSVGWLQCWLVGWLQCWLVGWLQCWLVGCSLGWLQCWLVGCSLARSLARSLPCLWCEVVVSAVACGSTPASWLSVSVCLCVSVSVCVCVFSCHCTSLPACSRRARSLACPLALLLWPFLPLPFLFLPSLNSSRFPPLFWEAPRPRLKHRPPVPRDNNGTLFVFAIITVCGPGCADSATTTPRHGETANTVSRRPVVPAPVLNDVVPMPVPAEEECAHRA